MRVRGAQHAERGLQRWGGTGMSSNSRAARQTGDSEETANDKDVAREPKYDIDNNPSYRACARPYPRSPC